MGRFKYLFLAVVAVTGLIGATPIDRGAQLPPITSLAVTIRQGNVAVDGYAAPAMRDRVLALVSTMQSGTARLTEQSLELNGVTSADAGFGEELAELRDELPAHMATAIDVFIIDADQAGSDVCERMFETVSALPAQFDETGILMRTASQPALDRIVDFALDCDESRIELVGHSDSTGPEAANVALSLTRAQRVADYLVARGVDSERLVLSAAGSAEPIADNATRLGRERNRRVEFRLTP
ncbi:MAG: OmpA family protein [Woeseiaceae bacterium]|nr:OmpA family protein [Woeseiaceae bacterium]